MTSLGLWHPLSAFTTTTSFSTGCCVIPGCMERTRSHTFSLSWGTSWQWQGTVRPSLCEYLKLGAPAILWLKAIYINNSFEATEYMLFQQQWQVAKILEQHRIKVKNFCLFPHDNVVTAHCTHCRLTLSRQQPTACIMNSMHSSSYSGFTTSFTGVVSLTSTFLRTCTGCFQSWKIRLNHFHQDWKVMVKLRRQPQHPRMLAMHQQGALCRPFLRLLKRKVTHCSHHSRTTIG